MVKVFCKIQLLVLFCLIYNIAQGQQLTGTVSDKASGRRLAGASVYMSNSSLGCLTNQDGFFTLPKLPAGQFELVISYVGFQTSVLTLTGLPDSSLVIALMSKESLLQEVVVRAYEKNGWAHWGFLFKTNFLGTSAYSDQCRIENPQDIQFSYSPSDNTLFANNRQPIVIINKALGYRIEYDLEEFFYGFGSHLLTVTGYAYFKEMEGSAKKKSNWLKSRNRCYEGSMMQFLRAVWSGRSKEEGFEVRIMRTFPDAEKRRVQSIREGNPSFLGMPADSIKYYSAVLNQHTGSRYLYRDPVDPEQFITRIRPQSVALLFDEYLRVSYPRKKQDPEYLARNLQATYDSCVTAVLQLEKQEPIKIFPFGNYADPVNLIISGYWAWSEKVSTLLPLDFTPDGIKPNKP